MHLYSRLLLFICLLHGTYGQQAMYECPYGWQEYVEHCYRFARYPMKDLKSAKASCATDGSRLISINSGGENQFVLSQLSMNDPGPTRMNWWTSGKRNPEANWKFYWEGDGTEIITHQFWLNDSIPRDWKAPKNYITYHHDRSNWGWILEEDKPQTQHPYICEIDKSEIFKIVTEERGPDYGTNNPNPETVPRGPYYVQQPVNTIHDINSVRVYTYLECVADAYPHPSYKWFKDRAGTRTPIDPSKDTRYTIVNGRLIIDQPSQARGDDGKYQCEADNPFGGVLSDIISLSFGYLQDFPKSPRAPVSVTSYTSATIECDPPDHFPSILYAWYKNNIYNFVRPDLKPYTFISHDGRLYFSEVTADDAGQYYCVVYKPGQLASNAPVSMPTQLSVNEGTPAIYEPVMAGGFPLVSPSSPQAGNKVRLECLAQGTMPLIYEWTRIHKTNPDDDSDAGTNIPFPKQAKFSDHNRVITISDIEINDGGMYKCIAKRRNGLSADGTLQFAVKSSPYFILPLRDQYADINTKLEWVCQGSGNPDISYSWYVNGTQVTKDSIPAEDKDRITLGLNSLTFKTLKLKDSGMYQCEAFNILGTVYTSAELRVLAFKPSFKKYPLYPNQYATIQGNTTIICRPEAAPYPEKTWFKNDIQLNPEAEGRVKMLPNGNLFISPVQASDQGVYKCVAKNDYGQDQTSGNLTVLETTTITMPPDPNINVDVNKTTFLHCGASHNPNLDITYIWYQNNVLIETEKIQYETVEVVEDPHFKRGYGHYWGGLYIMNAREQHSGRYTCMVASSVDYNRVYTDVRVRGAPYEPAGVRAEESTTTSMIIKWKAPLVDNGIPIKNFVVEGYNEHEAYWKVHITNLRTKADENDDHKVNVTGLHPWSDYQFRVRAENDIGTSTPSIPSLPHTTKNREPDIHPDQVGGGGGKVGDLVITWMYLPKWRHNAPGIGYRVRWRVTGQSEQDWSSKDVQGQVGRYVALVGAANYYKDYDVNVQAFNNVGYGPRSPTVTIKSAEDLPKTIPTNVMAQPYNATAILVHWNPVSDDITQIRGKLQGYRIMYWIYKKETPDMSIRRTVEGQVDQGLIIGLNINTMYAVNVLVWNNAGDGNIDNGQVYYQRTLRSAPKNMPTEVEVHYIDSTSVHVFFRGVSTDQTEEPLEGYYVRLWREGQKIKMAKDYDCDKETDIIIHNLIPKQLYKLRVLGYSQGGTGAMSSPTLRFILPSSAYAVRPSVLALFIITIITSLKNHL